ncbi:unnamed protein product [Rotaria magnacalcarata]|uniref:Caveolin n=3 Tax=Rotaria magnacalcarata TaxID=392030 RepID=A0A816W542_9BILA|nr:unnamed protein product [Rotaria magnacalcarata]CAF2126780.1 unnamed protein product [Rotaria magnacalcarata]CAF2130594.1 unnamed protein product [Rotaria magnacalcarata]CAF4095387.1 unnamed protein product [Rotaria magnacalcarata]CAF4196599.1 unnamed protein product [Rotaria magnacalcarata]
MAASNAHENSIYPSLLPDESDNRDPYGINKHLQLNFFNVIAEPDTSAYNFAVLHEVSEKVYQYSKLGIYRLLAVLIGLPLMLCWGIIFGAYTFFMIWIVAPSRRLSQSLIAECGIHIQTISDAVVAPLYRSFGQVFSSVRINLLNQTVETTKTIQV